MTQEWRDEFRGRRVFVTGATGFIGRPLVSGLVEAGAEVTVLGRSARTAASLDAKPARVVVGALADRATLMAALAPGDIVFNLAYDVRASAAENTAGFQSLLAAATQAGAARIVHTSSIVVYDGWPMADLDETGSMDRPGGSPYRMAKIGMERQLMAAALPAAILQPTIVYGPHSSLWTDHLVEALAGGGVVLPEPEGLCNGVFVGDVVQALMRAALVPDLGQERFIVSGPEAFSWSDLLNGYAAILGRGTLTHVPHAELLSRLGPRHEGAVEDAGPSAAARVSALGRQVLGRERFEGLVRLAKRKLGRNGPMTPDHHLLEVFSATGHCRIDYARSRLNYAPDYDLSLGLAATAGHIRDLAKAL